MERREPAPIWAAVFGRSELRFVFNEAGILNLTTFHAIYPRSPDREFAMALTACLNSPVVQHRAKLQHRVYGGGLLKYEPKDLLDIQVPNLRKVCRPTLSRLAQSLITLDRAAKSGSANQISEARNCLNNAVTMAAEEAVSQASLPAPEHPLELGPLWARRTHRDDPALSLGAPHETPAVE